MPAYAAQGTPDSIQITCRHIFRLFFAERATHRPSQASGCLAQPANCSRAPINFKELMAVGIPGSRRYAGFLGVCGRSLGMATSVKRKTSSPVTVLTS